MIDFSEFLYAIEMSFKYQYISKDRTDFKIAQEG